MYMFIYVHMYFVNIYLAKSCILRYSNIQSMQSNPPYNFLMWQLPGLMPDFQCRVDRLLFDSGVSFLGELTSPILTLIFVLDGDDLSFVTVTLSLAVSPSCTGNVLGGRNTFSPSPVKRRHEGGTVICMLLIFRASGCLRFSLFDTALGKVRSCPFFVVCVSSPPLVLGLDLGVGAAVSLGGGCEIGETLGKELTFVDGKAVGGRITEDGFK